MDASPAASAMDSSYMPSMMFPHHHHTASSNMEVTTPDFMGLGFESSQALMAVTPSGSGYMLPGTDDGMRPQQRNSEGFQAFPTHLPTRSLSGSNPVVVRNTSSSAGRVPWPSSSALMAGPVPSLSHGGPGATPQPIDYDAILEELGSIDCTDGLDMDPQFMTNLGFAPGADLGEMFQADFGS